MWYLLTALLSLLALGAGLRLGRKRRRAIWAYAAVLVLLLFKAALNHNPPWEFALFPHPAYIYFQKYLLFPLALFALGLGAALLPRGRNRKAVLLLAAFTFLVSLWTERWMLVEPDGSSSRRADQSHHCIQSTGYSCGPAACVTILSSLGIDATEGEMIVLCRALPLSGASLFQICRGLQLKLEGLPYEVRIVGSEFVRRQRCRAIMAPSRLHAIAIRFDGPRILVHDPLQPDPLERYGVPGGFAVCVLDKGG